MWSSHHMFMHVGRHVEGGGSVGCAVWKEGGSTMRGEKKETERKRGEGGVRERCGSKRGCMVEQSPTPHPQHTLLSSGQGGLPPHPEVVAETSRAQSFERWCMPERTHGGCGWCMVRCFFVSFSASYLLGVRALGTEGVPPSLPPL